jgi:hypothetical protein
MSTHNNNAQEQLDKATGTDENSAKMPVTAPAAPDPFDPAQFAVSGTILGEIGATKELVTCPVRKPTRQEFVRVHTSPEYKLRANILELREELETYLVMPDVAAALVGETRTRCSFSLASARSKS